MSADDQRAAEGLTYPADDDASADRSVRELQLLTECHCARDWTDRGMHHPRECQAEYREDVDTVVAVFDRLRAELAETRAKVASHEADLDLTIDRLHNFGQVGDALAEALNDLLVQLPGYMGPTAARPEREAAVDADNAWRSVRGDAPAPAKPPAVELPVTLSSVDDVAAKLCAGGGWKLTWSLEPDGLTREWEHDSGVHVRAEQGATIMVVTVRPASHAWPHWRGSGPDVHLDVLLAAIEAARGGAR